MSERERFGARLSIVGLGLSFNFFNRNRCVPFANTQMVLVFRTCGQGVDLQNQRCFFDLARIISEARILREDQMPYLGGEPATDFDSGLPSMQPRSSFGARPANMRKLCRLF
jgi:hypothetical protein